MTKEALRTMLLMMLCAAGVNATRLSNGLNAALFEAGVVFVSLTITIESLLQTVWKKRK